MSHRDKTVFVTQSSLANKIPVYHRTDGRYNMMMGLRMVCDPHRLFQFDCIEMPLRHATKFARPCLNCFRENR